MADSRSPYASVGIGKREFIALMALLMALNALAIDILLPALQQIGTALAVADANSRQLTLTAYVAMFGISQIIFGPVSDAFGRKWVLLSGMVVYIAGALIGALASDFAMLLLMRAVQGFGAGALRTVTVAIVRDLFKGRGMASIMSLVMMVFMIIPVIAPALGQAMEAVAGWRSILLFMAMAGFLTAVWVFVRLSETLPPAKRRPLQARETLIAFKMVLVNRMALGYALAFALTIGTLFGFLNSAQQIYWEVFGLQDLFPLAFAGSSIVMAAASFLNARLVSRFGMRLLSHAAAVAFVATNLVFVLVAAFWQAEIPFWVFYVLVTTALTLFAFQGPNYNALAMEPMGHIAGTAAAVIGSLQTVIGAIFGAAIGLMYDGTVTPMAGGFLLLSAASLAAAAWAENGRLFRPASEAELAL